MLIKKSANRLKINYVEYCYRGYIINYSNVTSNIKPFAQ